MLRRSFQPADIARSSEATGAACIAVITDNRYFQEDDEHLNDVREACALPLLHNDYILDSYQIIESRERGADCIVLIVSCLDDHELNEFSSQARELERAMLLRTPLIGINNRDLQTFKTDLHITLDLLVDVFHDRTVVSESGIYNTDNVALLPRNDVSGFLVGEALMVADDPGAKLKSLFGWIG